MDDQEKYLNETSVKKIFIRGFKKLITELTSVKFMLLCFVCVGVPMKWVGDTVGMSTALVIVGMREISIEAVVAKLAGVAGGQSG